jgi:hypothetical protein
MRWTEDGGFVGHVRRVVMTHFVATTGFSAGAFLFKLRQAVDWTANGSGGNPITVADVCKLDLGGSNVSPIGSDVANSDIRIASTGALTAGTYTITDGPMGHVGGFAPAAAGSLLPGPAVLYDCQASTEPLILRDDTGLVLQAVVPGTGVWSFGLLVEFAAGFPEYGYGQNA